MSKAVLMSIRPQWCELILRGKKTVEVRKSRPKLKPPFKVYIYATKPKSKNDLGLILDKGMLGNLKKVRFFHKCNYAAAKYLNMQILSGKVIGEFTCNLITPIAYTTDGLADVVDCKTACMKPLEFLAYGKGDVLYGWHISDLKIYDKPKELSEFYVTDNSAIQFCKHREITGQPEYKTAHNGWIKGSYICNANGEPDWCTKCKTKPITRPPQSWCYVEECEENA